MSQEFAYTCQLANGLHARPACLVSDLAKKYESEIRFANRRTNTSADARSVLALLAADIRPDDTCDVKVSGADEEPAAASLKEFLSNKLRTIETPIAAPPVVSSMPLPRSLVELELNYVQGKPLVPGITEGAIQLLPRIGGKAAGNPKSTTPALERDRFNDAMQSLTRRLASEAGCASGHAHQILCAHLAIANDSELQRRIYAEISCPGTAAGQAIISTAAELGNLLRQTGNHLLQERIADINDVCEQLLNELDGENSDVLATLLSRPSILCATSLSPYALLSLDRKFLRGLVLKDTGATSHTVILARSFGIPTICGIAPEDCPPAGSEAILDGRLGLLVRNSSAAAKRFFERERVVMKRRCNPESTEAEVLRTGPAETGMQVFANISSAAELEAAEEKAIDGVGLFRTEMLFLGRNDPPSETEQIKEYSRVLDLVQGKPVTFRLLDLGADKLPAYVARELNLLDTAIRGCQLYQHIATLIRTQIRAILRAGCGRNFSILVPMVSSPEELRAIRILINETRHELKLDDSDTLPFKLGAMIETPAAAEKIFEIGAQADYFSIGTNDLTQYFFSTTRERDSALAVKGRAPAFIKLLKKIVLAARSSSKPIGLCGEFASDALNLPLMAGLRLDWISVSVPLVPATKSRMSHSNSERCGEILQQAIHLQNEQQVAALLQRNTGLAEKPMLSRDLLVLESGSESKTEVIRELANLLYSTGRTDNPELAESALWKREEKYSTGLGHGFAIPHCVDSSIAQSSIAMVALKHSVDWNSIDGEPVKNVFLIATNEHSSAQQHLSAFSKLARNLMDDNFRSRIRAATDAAALLRILKDVLEPCAELEARPEVPAK